MLGVGALLPISALLTIGPAFAASAPVARDDAARTDASTQIYVDLTSNDYDVEGDSFSVTEVSSPAHGTVDGFASSYVVYTPSAGFAGLETLTYTVTDSTNQTATAKVRIWVDSGATSSATAPQPTIDYAVVRKGSSVGVSVPDILANDTDPNAQALTFLTIGLSSNSGTLTGTAAGGFTFTPDGTVPANSDVVLYYLVSDPDGHVQVGNVYIRVLNAGDANQPVVTRDDVARTDAATEVFVDLASNDFDPENEGFSVVKVDAAANGAVSAFGSYYAYYVPASGFSGVETLTYTVRDSHGLLSTGTARVYVDTGATSQATAPDPGDDYLVVSKGSSVGFSVSDLLSNDSDPNRKTLSVLAVAETGYYGGLTGSIATGFTYTPTPEAPANSDQSLRYLVANSDGHVQVGTVYIRVLNAGDTNKPPVAVPDNATTQAVTQVFIDLTSNDSDPENEGLSVASVENAQHGSVVNYGSYYAYYTPEPGFTGVETLTYTVRDGHGLLTTSIATVIVESPGNHKPVALSRSLNTVPGASAPVTLVAVDPDGDPITWSIVTPPKGSLTGTAPNLVYTPPASGTADSFTFRVNDGAVNSDVGTISINIKRDNHAPTATDDAKTTAEDTTASIPVLANDTDPDTGDVLVVADFSQGAHGSVSCTSSACSYVPQPNFHGTDSFNYTVSDGNGGSDVAEVSMTVSSVNDLPTAVDDSSSTPEDAALTVAVLANDSDVDGDTFAITKSSAAAHGTATCTPENCSYVPAANYSGPDSFTYTIGDGVSGSSTATVSINVAAINDPPAATSQTITAVRGVAKAITLSGTDVDGDALTYQVNTAPVGTLTGTPPNLTYTAPAGLTVDTILFSVDDGKGGVATGSVTITIEQPSNRDPVTVADTASTPEDTAVVVGVLANDSDPDGDSITVAASSVPAHGTAVCAALTCTYTPAPDYHGADSFTYTVSDGKGGSATGTVSVTVESINDGPTATADQSSTPEDTAATVQVLSNDSDRDGDTLTVSGHGSAAHGDVSCSTTACTYTPANNFFGPDSFNYTISDGQGGSATATVSVTVGAANDAPVAASASASVLAGGTVDIALSASDIDGDSLTYSVVTPPTGSLSGTAPNLTYTPAAGITTDSFTFRANDGTTDSNLATISITVGDRPNAEPKAADDTASATEDTSVTVSVLANDTDADDDTLTITGHSAAAHGAVDCTATTCTYSPTDNYNGADSFTYSVSDGHGGSATATVTLSIAAVNDAPDAVDDSASAEEDTALSIPVLGNDTDVDGDALTISGHSTPEHGVVVCSPIECVYTAAQGFSGTDSFTYVASDGLGGTDTATVTVRVNGVNDAPTPGDDSATTAEDTAVVVSVLANDSDPDGDIVTITSASEPAHGTAVCDASSCTYTPSKNFHGADSFTYLASDGRGGSASATVSVTVESVNDGPDAVNDATTTSEDTSTTVDVLGNDTDVEGDDLTISGHSSADHGVVDCSSSECTYLPTGDYSGTDSFEYTVSDGRGGSSTATVTLTVEPVNDAPVAVSASASVAAGGTVDIALSASDIDGDSLTYSVVTPPTGSLSGTAPNLTYTPAAGITSDSFTFRANDGTADSNLATISITVGDRPNADPEAVDDTASTPAGTAVTVSVLANDTDADEDSLTVTANSSSTHGSVTCTAATCTYTPDDGYVGPDEYTYTIDDGHGGSDTATVTVEVLGVNGAPSAIDDSATTDEDLAVSVAVLANDTDPDGDELTVVGNSTPQHGTAVCVLTSCTYTPSPDFHGSDSFTYTVSDGKGHTASAGVSIDVASVNDAPQATAVQVATSDGTPVAVTLTGSDAEGDALTFALETSPAHGQLTGTAPNLTYTPDVGFEGVDSFTFTASDGTATSDAAEASITVSPGTTCTPPSTLNRVAGTLRFDGGAVLSLDLTAIKLPFTTTRLWFGYVDFLDAANETHIAAPVLTTNAVVEPVSGVCGSAHIRVAAIDFRRLPLRQSVLDVQLLDDAPTGENLLTLDYGKVHVEGDPTQGTLKIR